MWTESLNVRKSIGVCMHKLLFPQTVVMEVSVHVQGQNLLVIFYTTALFQGTFSLIILNQLPLEE